MATDHSPSEFAHLPHTGLTVTWAHPAEQLHEALTLRFENEGWTADGLLANGAREFSSHQYVVRLSATWKVQQLLLFRDMDEPDLWLANDGTGRWGEMNGAMRRELGGCHDVHVNPSPFTATLAIRRLRLVGWRPRKVRRRISRSRDSRDRTR